VPPKPITRLRKLCIALPETQEVEAWGAPTFRVRNKLFAMYSAENSSHSGGRPAVWIKAGPGNQSLMVSHAPTRFFSPPYMGPSGWVGVWLDDVCKWDELEELLRDAWRLTAPKRLAATLGEEEDDDEAPPKAQAKSKAKAAKAPAKAAKAPAKRARPSSSSSARKTAAEPREAARGTSRGPRAEGGAPKKRPSAPRPRGA
jgi:hypothetical protein